MPRSCGLGLGWPRWLAAGPGCSCRAVVVPSRRDRSQALAPAVPSGLGASAVAASPPGQRLGRCCRRRRGPLAGAGLAVCCLLATAPAALADPYRTLHVVDIATATCGSDSTWSSDNLALGKTVTCQPGVLYCDTTRAQTVTDGNKQCNLEPQQGPMTRSSSCAQSWWVQIDLGEELNVNNVVLYQSPCKAQSFCGHKVAVSTDNENFDVVYDAGTVYSSDAVQQSYFFENSATRYVRVYSSRPRTGDITFDEIELYSRSPQLPNASAGIDFTSEVSLQNAYVISFLRSKETAVTLDFHVEDAEGVTVVSRREVTLMDLNTYETPSNCQCTGTPLPTDLQAAWGPDYGTTCGNWDEANCSDVWGTTGPSCCAHWCYSSGCMDEYESVLWPGHKFSFTPCQEDNDAVTSATCTVKPDQGRDPCECVPDIYNIFNAGMKDKFSEGYGATCGAWDSQNCEFDYATPDTWCCSTWCYVDITCPYALPSFNPGMEGLLFWAETSCEQDPMDVSQCPYRKTANKTAMNTLMCQCLDIAMPADLLSAGAPADYGRHCLEHDAEICSSIYPNNRLDMWCCLPWCWVSEQCPDAIASTIWPGHFFSGMSCETNASVVSGCQYSDSCQCQTNITGINKTKLGEDYGSSCGAWDGADCFGFMGDTAFWGSGRNDWCCDRWCYVNETCPVASVSFVGSALPWSGDVCQDGPELYQNSTNTCQAPGSCECLNIELPADLLPPGARAGYGTTCAEHDIDICSNSSSSPDIECCLAWCWVDELCPSAKPSQVWPGHWYATTEACEINTTLVKTCPYSDLCSCTDQSLVGTNLPQDYGSSCNAWDAECEKIWGPTSGRDFDWNATADNSWCCSPWCFVSLACPLTDVKLYGQGVLRAFSYQACWDNQTSAAVWPNLTYDANAGTCAAGPGGSSADRRLTAEASGRQVEPPPPRQRPVDPSPKKRRLAYTTTRIRRRTPQRPAAPDTRRRAPVVPLSAYRRRRTKVTENRRRTTDVAGGARETLQGRPYGFTSLDNLIDVFGGRAPRMDLYGYTGMKTRLAGEQTLVSAMGGSKSSGGGSYTAYNLMYNGLSFTSWRRRRATQIEWCLAPTGDEIGKFIECWDCFQRYGACRSASDCYSSKRCMYTLPVDLHMDTLLDTGFVPAYYTPPLKLVLHKFGDAGGQYYDVCPPTGEDDAESLDLNRYKPEFFVTLTELNRLSGGTASDDPLSTKPLVCLNNTGYECKKWTDGGVGEEFCYGPNEVCVKDLKLLFLCECREGYCLVGPSRDSAFCESYKNVENVPVDDARERSSTSFLAGCFLALAAVSCSGPAGS